MSRKYLLIDAGNTRLKWLLDEPNDPSTKGTFIWQQHDLFNQLQQQWADYSAPDAVIISNVAGDNLGAEISRWCQKRWSITPMFAGVEQAACGVSNSYTQPAQLGVDRWMAIIAANHIFNEPVCIVDCGSAVTIDMLSEQGVYLGGMIAPGLSLLARALTDHTHALTARQADKIVMLAKNTDDGINAGCYHMFIEGLLRIIEKMAEQFGDQMEVLLTGGDAKLVMQASEQVFFHEPDLVLKGLQKYAEELL